MLFNRDFAVVGYDLSNEYCQISYMTKSMKEPETIENPLSEGELNIPLCVYRSENGNQWEIGTAAAQKASAGQQEEGVFIASLWDRAVVGDMLLIGEEEFDPLSLLILFVKRSLGMLPENAGMDNTRGIMFTIPAVTPKTIEILETITDALQLDKVRVFYQGREESIYYYVINQSEDVWRYQVMVYDYGGEHMKSYRFYQNYRSKPMVAMIDTLEHADMTLKSPDRDEKFLQILKSTIGTNPVSSVFLLGEGFRENWCKTSLKFLCSNRRAFRGNNLYSRGACYSCMDMLEGILPENKDRIFLGKDKLRINIGINVNVKDEEKYISLLNGGNNWFDSKATLDLLMGRENTVTITLIPLDGRGAKDVVILLDGLLEREEKTTRIRLDLFMESENMLRVNVTDLGFGEFFPASNQLFTKEIKLYD